MVAAGEAERAVVAGVEHYAAAGLTVPRAAHGRRFLSPFDPLIFFRPRAEALFAMRYRIGIYTPARKRDRGYYSLPFLLDDAICARADLALDRARSRLLVRGAWYEPDGQARRARAARGLAAELEVLAAWLGASAIDVEPDAPGEAAADLTCSPREIPRPTRA